MKLVKCETCGYPTQRYRIKVDNKKRNKIICEECMWREIHEKKSKRK